MRLAHSRVLALGAATLLAAAAQAVTAPRIIDSSRVGTPSWTSATIIDDLRSDESFPDLLRESFGSIQLSGNVSVNGGFVPGGGESTSFLQTYDSDNDILVSADPDQLRTFSFSVQLNPFVNLMLLATNAAGRQTVLYMCNQIAAIRVGQVTVNQDASSSLSTVEFFTTGRALIDNIAAAAPEPASWSTMLVGFGIAGSVLRRRRVRIGHTG